MHAPGCELAWVHGYCVARSSEPVESRPDLRREPGEPDVLGLEDSGTPIARVEIRKGQPKA